MSDLRGWLSRMEATNEEAGEAKGRVELPRGNPGACRDGRAEELTPNTLAEKWFATGWVRGRRKAWRSLAGVDTAATEVSAEALDSADVRFLDAQEWARIRAAFAEWMETAPRDDGRDPLAPPPPAVPPQGREVLFGVAHTRSRPAPKHAHAASALGEALVPPFKASRTWHIAEQPELRLGEHVLAADLAAWRGERTADLPTDTLHFVVSPDWVCEVLASSTTALDRGDKLTIYRTHGVSHVWLVDPEAKTLEVLQLDGPTYRIAAVFSGDAAVRAAPFDVIELDLSILWAR